MAAHHWITWANVCGVLKRAWTQHSSSTVGQERPFEDHSPLFQACFSLAEGCGTLESLHLVPDLCIFYCQRFQPTCQGTNVSLFLFTGPVCLNNLHTQRKEKKSKHHDQVQCMRGLTELFFILTILATNAFCHVQWFWAQWSARWYHPLRWAAITKAFLQLKG